MTKMESEAFSPVKPQAEDTAIQYSVEWFSSEIRAKYQMTVTGLMQVARLCAEADDGLMTPQRRQLIGKLPFSEATFSKYLTIAKELHSLSVERMSMMPASFSTIYDIAKLGVNDRERAFNTGIINPDLTRADLQRWKNNTSPLGPKNAKLQIFAHVQVPTAFAPDQQQILSDALADIANNLGIEIDFVQERKEWLKWEKSRHRCLLRSVGRIAREAKKRNIKKYGNDPDDINIDKNSSEADMLRVLDVIGRQDEFDKIRQLAERGEVY
jgi:hypothetical protein